MQTFLKFLVAGCLGFVIDAIVFFALVGWAGAPWWLARIAAFLVAVCATWYVNRRFTFGSRALARPQALRYLLVQSAGCGVNYVVLVVSAAWLRNTGLPVWPYLFGTAAGLAWNYSLCRSLVFRPERA